MATEPVGAVTVWVILSLGNEPLGVALDVDSARRERDSLGAAGWREFKAPGRAVLCPPDPDAQEVLVERVTDAILEVNLTPGPSLTHCMARRRAQVALAAAGLLSWGGAGD
jgi:hypothetical protein